ncbi:MAG: ATP-binding protein [Cyclobacteriaceae bacterium]
MKAFQRKHSASHAGRGTLFCLLITLSVLGQSQDRQKKFETVLVKDGLVQSSVIDITTDEYGYVWFGTYGGLSRFDGSEFVNFYHDPDDTTSLSNSSVWSLMSSGDGNLWVGTSNGLNKYDWSMERFVQYKYMDLNGHKIESIEHWSEDTLMLGTTRGLYFFDRINESYFQMPRFDRFNKSHIFSQKTKAGDLLLYSNGFFHLFGENEPVKLRVDSVIAIHTDKKSNIWAVTFNDLRLISSDLLNSTILSTELPADYNAKITEDHQGNIYVLGGKLQVFSPSGKLIESHDPNPDKEFSLMDNSLISIHIGNDGIWWIGTAGYGVNKYDPNRPTLGFMGHTPRYTPSLSNSYVTSFYSEDDKTVLIGTASSLDVFDTEQITVESIYPQRVDFLSEANGRYWGAAKDALIQIDLEKKKVVRTIPIDNLTHTRAIKAIGNSLWIASSLGLRKLDLNTEKMQIFLPPSDFKKGRTTGDLITAIHQMEGELLLGTAVGLYQMELSNETAYPVKNPILSPLQDRHIKCIKEDKNGIIWIGTSGEGLYRWDRINNMLDHFTRKDGLPNDVIYGVLEDENGFLWMSTNYGLSRMDDQTKEFVNIDISYGLQSNEFNTNAYFRSPNGVFYFGGVQGLNYFNPGQIENPTKPDTHITGFYLSNQRVAPKALGINSAIMDVDTLILDYHQNMLGFDFKSSNLTISKLNQYAYYLANLEEDWNYVGNRRFANYASLPAGEYIFKVKSSNNNGLWDTTPAQIVIIITEPYWQTSWFRVLIIAVILIVILTVTSLRIQHLERKEIKLKKLVDERTGILQATNEELKRTIEEKENTQQKLIQSEKMAALGTLSAGVGHEINNPLNIIDQALFSLENELDDKGSGNPKKLAAYINFMHEGVSRASQIVKSLSNFSRSGISYDEKCNIEALLDDCIVLLNHQIKYKATIVKNYGANGIEIKGNGGKLHQVFFNLLSNAVQSILEKGTITISTYTRKKNLMVVVTDTGEGIGPDNLSRIFDPFFTTKDAGEGTGLGLSITHTIIKEHKGSIKVSSEINKGSTFTVSLPIPN